MSKLTQQDIAILFAQSIADDMQAFNDRYHGKFTALLRTDVDLTHLNHEKVLIYVSCFSPQSDTEDFKFELDAGEDFLEALTHVPQIAQEYMLDNMIFAKKLEINHSIIHWVRVKLGLLPACTGGDNYVGDNTRTNHTGDKEMPLEADCLCCRD